MIKRPPALKLFRIYGKENLRKPGNPRISFGPIRLYILGRIRKKSGHGFYRFNFLKPLSRSGTSL